MPLEDYVLLDTSMVPWPTTPSDWYNCLVPKYDEAVFIEHSAIVTLMLSKGEDVIADPEPLDGGLPGWARNFSSRYSEYANEMGFRVAKALHDQNIVRQDKAAMEFRFADHPKSFRMGFFGGKTFVFLPKPQFEAA